MEIPAYIKVFSTSAVKMLMLIFITASNSLAQNVEFSASAPPVVAVGEQFRLTYSLNNRGNNLRLPDFAGFQLLSGPSTSSSSSVQIINGQMTQTQSFTYTYVLRANEAGKYTIGPATIVVESNQYTSNSIDIEVVTDSDGRSSVPGRQTPGGPVRQGDITGDDLFVRIMLDREEVYQGEGVVATIKLFSKLDLTGIENVRFPALSGFYQQDIETPPLRSLDREIIGGEIYGTGVLKQMIIFPQRSGEINIGSFEMDAVVRQRAERTGSLFDDFFGGFETRRIPVKSPPLNLKVKPIPDQRPNDFTGAIGDFDLKVDIDPREIRTNEAASLRVTISGKGNLGLLGQPRVDFPPDFEVYDPGVRENIRNSVSGQEGSITYEYLMIPRSEGNFRIPPVRFSYFNPGNATFRTIGSGEFNLLVEKSDDAEDRPSIAGFSREDLRILGSDIRFIKTGTVMFNKIDHDPFRSLRYYLWFIGALIVFTGLIIIQRKKIRERADIAKVKNRRARKMAHRRLKNAEKHMKDNDRHMFFDEMLKAHWGYLSDKLLISVSELNRENTKFALLEKNVPEKDTEKIIEIIEECEYARYAPLSSDGDMERIYRDTIKIITEIEQNIRQ